MKIEDGYYHVSEPIFIGSIPIRSELEILPESEPPSKGWFVKEVISVNGNKYLKLLAKYLKKVGKSSEDDLSKEEIDNLYDKASYK